MHCGTIRRRGDTATRPPRLKAKPMAGRRGETSEKEMFSRQLAAGSLYGTQIYTDIYKDNCELGIGSTGITGQTDYRQAEDRGQRSEVRERLVIG